jgi:hypothetical protein
MKKSNYFLGIIFFALIIISAGCQTSIYTLTNQEKVYPSTDVSKITVTTMEKSDKNYIEVGYIFAAGNTIDDGIKNLKSQTSKFGGDAVLRLKISVIRQFIMLLFIPIPVDTYFCEGIAVKYQ